ncbi:hypothetical protein EBS43_09535, partial [bacterium]|nr:hypothetical protein [bacterium]
MRREFYSKQEDALDALDALSVSVEDADAQTDAEQALFGEPGMPPPKDGWQRSRLIALFPSEENAREAAKLLSLQDFFEGCEVLGVQNLVDQDCDDMVDEDFIVTGDIVVTELDGVTVRSIIGTGERGLVDGDPDVAQFSEPNGL